MIKITENHELEIRLQLHVEHHTPMVPTKGAIITLLTEFQDYIKEAVNMWMRASYTAIMTSLPLSWLEPGNSNCLYYLGGMFNVQEYNAAERLLLQSKMEIEETPAFAKMLLQSICMAGRPEKMDYTFWNRLLWELGNM